MIIKTAKKDKHEKKFNKKFSLKQIKRMVPQRFPMLMLDQIVDFEPEIRIVGVRTFRRREYFYQGHFPGYAITPGGMIAEAMAQAATILLRFSFPQTKNTLYLVTSIKIRFFGVVRPGQQIYVEVFSQRIISKGGIFKAKVTAKNLIIAKGEFGLAAKNKRDLGYLDQSLSGKA